MVFQNNLLMGAGGQAAEVYEIDESCRFNDDDSAYTGSTLVTPTSERIFTFSFWVKRGNLGTDQDIWSYERDDGGNTYAEIMFLANDKLRWKAENTGGANIFDRQTNAVFRDPSAWYHVVCVVDSNQTDSTAADIYVNGVVQTYSSTIDPGSAQDLGWPSTSQPFEVGRRFNGSTYLDAYLANFYFIDGQKLTPSSFGETNSTTGQWVPKEYSGTFGNAGLFLDFSVAPGTGDGAGTDSSGNDNDLTDSGLAANDQVVDTPTDNYCTWNPIGQSSSITLSDGNLKAVDGGGTFTHSTFELPSSGKWYFEVKAIVSSEFQIGVHLASGGMADTGNIGDSSGEIGYRSDGGRRENGTTTGGWGASFVTDAVIGVAWDADANKIWFAKNNTWQASGDPSAGTNPANTTTISTDSFFSIRGDSSTGGTANFGQLGFTYTPPSGFSALSTANLDNPTISDPSAYFQTTLYTGDGASSLAVNQGGNNTFEPDFVWIKNRDATDAHVLFDTVRGATKLLVSNTTAAEVTDADTLTAFDSDGFTVGADVKVNTNTEKYVGWQWFESAAPGFDIVSYTGNATNRTISHSLSAVPKLIIVKNLADTDNWAVYHASNTAAPATDYLILNTTAATADEATIWNDTAPTSSVFSVGTSSLTNGNTEAMIAYLWAGVEGFSKFGSYEGNGNADGKFIYTGMKLALVICKSIDSTSDWFMFDNQRLGYNVDNNSIFSNTTAAELTADNIDILSNGFKMRIATDPNVAETYIYIAFAETPFKTATAR